jgi:hypothetical protein
VSTVGIDAVPRQLSLLGSLPLRGVQHPLEDWRIRHRYRGSLGPWSGWSAHEDRRVRGGGLDAEGEGCLHHVSGWVAAVRDASDLLEFQLKVAHVPYKREDVFARPRRFRFDFRISDDLAVEVDGGGWINGRHSRGSGMLTDCEKFALAAARGIRVIRVMPEHVADGRALKWIEDALAFRPGSS